ncbi:hypothetical protein BBUWI9123_NPA0006 (plasmid) [Borreliella burgdorferi WI91-23]|nr:hypothetical protein BBUWI9123_NPA0006 [Borreliella burgdorferi WI91-23]
MYPNLELKSINIITLRSIKIQKYKAFIKSYFKRTYKNLFSKLFTKF